MKGALSTSRSPLFPASFDKIPFGALLILASLVAIAWGMASSLLFFGLLLAFSLLLLLSRRLSR